MSRSADEIPAIKPNVIRAVAVASAMCPFAGKTSKKKPRPAVVAHASPNTIPRNRLRQREERETGHHKNLLPESYPNPHEYLRREAYGRDAS